MSVDFVDNNFITITTTTTTTDTAPTTTINTTVISSSSCIYNYNHKYKQISYINFCSCL